MNKILVLFDSATGNVKQMADLVGEGAASVPDTDVRVLPVEEAKPADVEWCDGLAAQAAEFRAFEVSVALSEHIKLMGFDAEAHDRDTGRIDLERLAVLSGVCIRDKKNITHPFLGQDYSLAGVTTEYVLEIDLPLAKSGLKARGLSFWLGVGGAVPGIEWNRRKKKKK